MKKFMNILVAAVMLCSIGSMQPNNKKSQSKVSKSQKVTLTTKPVSVSQIRKVAAGVAKKAGIPKNATQTITVTPDGKRVMRFSWYQELPVVTAIKKAAKGTWNFAKRHAGKLVAGAATAAVLAHKGARNAAFSYAQQAVQGTLNHKGKLAVAATAGAAAGFYGTMYILAEGLNILAKEDSNLATCTKKFFAAANFAFEKRAKKKSKNDKLDPQVEAGYRAGIKEIEKIEKRVGVKLPR